MSGNGDALIAGFDRLAVARTLAESLIPQRSPTSAPIRMKPDPRSLNMISAEKVKFKTNRRFAMACEGAAA
jgi:hypothetical protein